MRFLFSQFTETKGTEIKNRKLKKQQTYHGEIVQLSQQLQHRQVKSKSKADGEDALDKEEQENLKKLKEKAIKYYYCLLRAIVIQNICFNLELIKSYCYQLTYSIHL